MELLKIVLECQNAAKLPAGSRVMLAKDVQQDQNGQSFARNAISLFTPDANDVNLFDIGGSYEITIVKIEK